MNKLKELGKRIKENFKKNKVVFFVFVTIWIITIILTIIANASTLSKLSYGNEYNQVVTEINKETKIVETVPVLNGSKDIAIKFATYARNNKGNIYIEVIGNKTKKEYASVKVNIRNINDNAYYTLSLKEQLNDKIDSSIIVTLTSDSEPGKGIGVYQSSNKYFDDSSCTINKIEQDGDLTIKFLIEDFEMSLFSKYILTFTILFISLLIVILILIQPKYEILFSTLALLVGLIFMIIITPLSVPDEQVHYEAALQMSNYVLSDDYHTKINADYVNYSHYYGHHNVSLGYVRLIEQFSRPLNKKAKTVDTFRDIEDIYTVYFIPQTIGVFIGRLFEMNFLKTFYLGRLTNLLFYCLCVYIAIKKTPVNKLLLGLISCLPIFIQAAASNSYDCFINGLCLVNIGILFKWMYQDEEINKYDYILAFIVCLVLAPAKYVYACLAPLFFLVPWKRYGSKWKKIIFTLILCGPMLYQLVPILLPRFKDLFESLLSNPKIFNVVKADYFDNFSLEIEEEYFGEPYTLKYVLAHLKDTIMFVMFTVRYNLKPWFYGAIGGSLSGTTLILPHIMTYSIIALLVTSSIRKEEESPTLITRFSIVTVSIIMGLFIVGGMLLYWTNIGDYYIQGVQGRYFCPIIIYFFTIFNNKKINLPEKIDKYVIFAYLILIFEVIVYVLSYTFVN